MRRLLLASAALVCTGLLAGCMNIVFSPDGKTMAFPWSDGKDGFIATMGMDGSGLRFLSGSHDLNPVAWSPDGKRLLAAPPSGQADGDLVLLNLEAGRSRKVLDRAMSQAAWTDSNDRVIVAQNGGPGGEPDSMIWLELSSGKILSRVELKDVNVEQTQPILWLSDTDGAAFLGTDGNAYLVWRGELRKVTTTDDVVGIGSDKLGKKLVWARKSRNARYILLSIYEYDINLRSVRKLPFPDRIPQINPSPQKGPNSVEFVRFSPSLKEFALLTEEPSTDSEKHHALHRVTINGKSAQRLGAYANSQEAPVAFNWSPDGATIAFIDATETTMKLRLNGPNGSRTLRTVTVPKR